MHIANLIKLKNMDHLPYVKLHLEYMQDMCWTNDPKYLHLEVYFGNSEPNLSANYRVDGLKPVIKEKDCDRFILRDAKGRFYIWDAWDVLLLRVREAGYKGLQTNEEIVENILDYISLVEEDAMVIRKNRAED
jgi:hypothetical protein